MNFEIVIVIFLNAEKQDEYRIEKKERQYG